MTTVPVASFYTFHLKSSDLNSEPPNGWLCYFEVKCDKRRSDCSGESVCGAGWAGAESGRVVSRDSGKQVPVAKTFRDVHADAGRERNSTAGARLPGRDQSIVSGLDEHRAPAGQNPNHDRLRNGREVQRAPADHAMWDM